MPDRTRLNRANNRLRELLEQMGLVPKRVQPAIARVPVRRGPVPRRPAHPVPRQTRSCG